MKRLAIGLLVAAAIWAATAEHPHFKRAALTSVEKSFDRRIMTLADDPYLLVGDTRGIYLEGYGAVFTAEVNLANGPSLSPFRPSITKDDIARIRVKKLERFPILRQQMQDALLAAAGSLNEIRPNEQIVIGVSLLYRAEEDASGMPGQILMQGEKAQLLDAKVGRLELGSAVKVREF